MARRRYLARCEALRILARWREGRDYGITPDLVDWCLQQTGDMEA